MSYAERTLFDCLNLAAQTCINQHKSQTVGHIQRQLDAFSIHFELAGMQNVFLAQSLGIPFAEFVERRHTVSFRGFHFDRADARLHRGIIVFPNDEEVYFHGFRGIRPIQAREEIQFAPIRPELLSHRILHQHPFVEREFIEQNIPVHIIRRCLSIGKRLRHQQTGIRHIAFE